MDKPPTTKPTLTLAPDVESMTDVAAAHALWEVVGNYLDAAGGPLFSKVRSLPNDWRAAYVLQYLKMEVENGGFHQFFTNSQGCFDSHLLQDIGFLGHPGYEAVLKDALQRYAGVDYQEQWENIGNSWEKFTAGYKEGLFDDLEQRYYALTPSIPEVIGKRLKERAPEFVNPDNPNPLDVVPQPGPGRVEHPFWRLFSWNPFAVAVPLVYLWYVANKRDFSIPHTLGAGFVSIWFLMAAADFISGHKLINWIYRDESDE